MLLYGGELDPRERELVILRTGWNCQSDYEWGQHKAIGLARRDDGEGHRGHHARPLRRWLERRRSLLITAADELHADSKLSDATYAALEQRYNKKQIIELLMVVGQYHLVSMLLNSLEVQRDKGVEGFPAS